MIKIKYKDGFNFECPGNGIRSTPTHFHIIYKDVECGMTEWEGIEHVGITADVDPEAATETWDIGSL